MSLFSTLFVLLGTLGFIICVVLTIANAIKKKPIKSFVKGIGVCLVLIILGTIMMPPSDKTNDSNVASSEQQKEDESDKSKINDSKEEKTSDTKDKEALKNKLKKEENLTWVGDVTNDVTGNWRLSEFASNDTVETFALDYYNAFFENDNEIHAVINRTLKTTANISILGGKLDVTIHEYVDGEEHDAKELFTGMVLGEYSINLDSGKIEKIR